MESTFSFLQYKIYHNTLYDWLIAILIIVVSILFARAIYWLISRTIKYFLKLTSSTIDDVIIQRIDTPVAMGVIVIGIRSALKCLEFPRLVNGYVHNAFVLLSALTITWLLTRVARAIIELQFKKRAEQDDLLLDVQMLSVIKRTVIVLLWVMGAVVGLNNAGINVSALIAGLGIGGLAFALAAQDTVKNLIGGIVIFLDKPFRLGDIIRVKEFEGVVTYIGMRSTRLRNGGGRIITVPNAQFSDNGIENISLEPSRRIVTHLALICETEPEKMEKAIAILQAIVDTSPNIIALESLIYFEKFSTSSFDINFTYFIKKEQNIQTTQTEINLEIVRKFKQAGLEMAYPTQVSYDRTNKEPASNL